MISSPQTLKLLSVALRYSSFWGIGIMIYGLFQYPLQAMIPSRSFPAEQLTARERAHEVTSILVAAITRTYLSHIVDTPHTYGVKTLGFVPRQSVHSSPNPSENI
jgi:hypothetical protein